MRREIGELNFAATGDTLATLAAIPIIDTRFRLAVWTGEKVRHESAEQGRGERN